MPTIPPDRDDDDLSQIKVEDVLEKSWEGYLARFQHPLDENTKRTLRSVFYAGGLAAIRQFRRGQEMVFEDAKPETQEGALILDALADHFQFFQDLLILNTLHFSRRFRNEEKDPKLKS